MTKKNREHFNLFGSPVTVTVPAEFVNLNINTIIRHKNFWAGCAEIWGCDFNNS